MTDHIASTSVPTAGTMGPSHRIDDQPVLPSTGFVRQRLLLRFVPFSKSTLWRRVKAGDFPAPVKLSSGITAWKAEEVRGWISGRL